VLNSSYGSPCSSPFCAQFENLTANPAAVLADLQRFVGLDPALAPSELPRENIRWATTHQCAEGDVSKMHCSCSSVRGWPWSPLRTAAAARWQEVEVSCRWVAHEAAGV